MFDTTLRRLIGLAFLGLAAFGCDDDDGGETTTDAASLDAAVDATVEPDAGAEPDMAPAPDLGPEPDMAVVSPAPTINEANAFKNDQEGAFGLRVVGNDPTEPQPDVDGFELELLDAQGNDLLQAAAALRFTSLRQGSGDYIGEWSFSYDLESPLNAATRMRIVVFDKEENRSEPLELDLEPTPVVDEGEVCDFDRGLVRCAEGNLCASAAGGRRTCQTAVQACPDFFEVTVLDEQPDWTYDGDTTGAPTHAIGTCGGGSGDEVFSFTAPEAGQYQFRTSGDRGTDTLIYARRFCDFEDAISRLGCNDDALPGFDLGSSLVIDMAAGDTVFIFVDGFNRPDDQGGPWTGPYRLRARRVEPLTVSAVAGWIGVEEQTLAFRVDGADVDGDLAGLQVVLRDAEGNPLLGNPMAPEAPQIIPTEVWSAEEGADYVGWATVTLRMAEPDSFAQVARASVVAFDAAFFASAVQEIELQPVPVVEENGRCARGGGFTACADELRCLPAVDEPPPPADADAAFQSLALDGACQP